MFREWSSSIKLECLMCMSCNHPKRVGLSILVRTVIDIMHSLTHNGTLFVFVSPIFCLSNFIS